MESKRRPQEKWYRSKWARRAALMALGAVLGASCVVLPEVMQPACVALVKVIHLIGVP